MQRFSPTFHSYPSPLPRLKPCSASSKTKEKEVNLSWNLPRNPGEEAQEVQTGGAAAVAQEATVAQETTVAQEAAVAQEAVVAQEAAAAQEVATAQETVASQEM